jgi:filamentous hemagglutinin
VRAGQVHYQDNENNKYYYNNETNTFINQKDGKLAPKSVQNKLNDKKFKATIDKAVEKYLGESTYDNLKQ